MSDDFFAINGRVVPAAQATISVLDLAFLRGVGAFETLRTYDGHPHQVREHMDRLWKAAAACNIPPCFSETDLRQVIAEILVRSRHPDLRVNIVVSPGDHTVGVFGAASPRWVVIARDVHAPEPEAYAFGVAVVTVPGKRLFPEVKSTCYLPGVQPMQIAGRTNAHEALYVQEDGSVTEGITSNVLAVRGSVVTTPVKNCLPGMTKAGIKPLAIAAGMTWVEDRLTAVDLATADEVWITSSVRELLPVTRIDGRPVANGEVGPWAKLIGPQYRAWSIASAKQDNLRYFNQLDHQQQQSHRQAQQQQQQQSLMQQQQQQAQT